MTSAFATTSRAGLSKKLAPGCAYRKSDSISAYGAWSTLCRLVCSTSTVQKRRTVDRSSCIAAQSGRCARHLCPTLRLHRSRLRSSSRSSTTLSSHAPVHASPFRRKPGSTSAVSSTSQAAKALAQFHDLALSLVGLAQVELGLVPEPPGQLRAPPKRGRTLSTGPAACLAAALLMPPMRARKIGENAPHQLSRDGKEVHALSCHSTSLNA